MDTCCRVFMSNIHFRDNSIWLSFVAYARHWYCICFLKNFPQGSIFCNPNGHWCNSLLHNNLMYTMYILYFHAAFTCWLGLGVCWILVPICIQNNCFLFCVGEIRSHNFSDQFTLQIKPFVRVRRLADKKGDNWMNLLIKRECFLFILTLDKLERKILFI